eukprot:CAMPEP_0113889462 /NCGR_PEP_ID=MMETSP0780_2-20120614/13509_1 /TAXON_ID=652834 /ORGANISM="Palpitomonas bilix" /LENGTH=493 /DNA_ID=CAMNT_0000878561 /DNA_START=56 /DNA_END=1538 /DNA_ORIENTATION=+ /assembly_acc=CAM_ASM_000599
MEATQGPGTSSEGGSEIDHVIQHEGEEHFERVADKGDLYLPLAVSPCGKMMAIWIMIPSKDIDKKSKFNMYLAVLYLVGDGEEQRDEDNVSKESKEREESVHAPRHTLIYPSTKWRTVLDERLPSRAMSACFSPCSRYLAVLCGGGTLHVWSIGTRRREVRGKGEIRREGVRWGKCSFISLPSSSSDTLLSYGDIPFFVPFIVKKFENEEGIRCFFSPCGSTLAAAMKSSLHFFRVPADMDTGAFTPCSTLPRTTVKREGVSDSLPCYHIGQVERSVQLPDSCWITFADRNMQYRTEEYKWRYPRCPLCCQHGEKRGRSSGKYGKEKSASTKSCGAHVLERSRIDWNGFSDLSNQIEKRVRGTQIWSSTGMVAIEVQQEKEASQYPRAGILLFRATPDSIDVCSGLKSEMNGRKKTKVVDIHFGPNSDHYMFVQVQVGVQFFLYVYRHDEKEDRSRLANYFSYRKVQEIEYSDFVDAFSICTFFSPSHSHVYV